jgi:hypothetical protein
MVSLLDVPASRLARMLSADRDGDIGWLLERVGCRTANCPPLQAFVLIHQLLVCGQVVRELRTGEGNSLADEWPCCVCCCYVQGWMAGWLVGVQFGWLGWLVG